MEDETLDENYWLLRNVRGEPVTILDKKPIEGMIPSKDKKNYLVVITKTNDDLYECFTRHWATSQPNFPDTPAYLRGECEPGEEDLKPIGTIERIPKIDYENYDAFGLFDD